MAFEEQSRSLRDTGEVPLPNDVEAFRMITQGNNVTVTHQIVVNGQVAFEANDVVNVESVSPNLQRPEYKYT